MTEEKLCRRCEKEMKTFFWTMAVSYGNKGSIYKEKMCGECIAEKFDLPIERLRYMEELTAFENKPHYRSDSWTKAQKREFIRLLEKKKIPIQNYGIPLYWHDEDAKDLVREYRKMQGKAAYDERLITCTLDGNDDDQVEEFESWLKQCPVQVKEKP